MTEEEAGLPHLEAALAIAQRSGVDDIVACRATTSGRRHLQLGDAGGEDELLGSLEVARQIGNHEFVMRSYYNLVEGLWRLGDYTEAGHYLAAAEDYSRDRDFPVNTYMCRRPAATGCSRCAASGRGRGRAHLCSRSRRPRR